MYKILTVTARKGAEPGPDPTKDAERKFTLRVSDQLSPGQERQAARKLIKDQLGDGWRLAGVMY